MKDWSLANRRFITQVVDLLFHLIQEFAVLEERTPIELFPHAGGTNSVAQEIVKQFYSRVAAHLQVRYSRHGESLQYWEFLVTVLDDLILKVNARC